MELLNPKKHLSCRPLVPEGHAPLAVEAVIRRMRDGSIWADSPDTPRCAVVVWQDDTLHIQVLQNDDTEPSSAEIREFLQDELFPQLAQEGNHEFRLLLPSCHAELAATLLQGLPLLSGHCAVEALPTTEPVLPQGSNATELSLGLLDGPMRGNVSELREAIIRHWGSTETFVARGWGTALEKERRLLAWAFTATVAGDRSEAYAATSDDCDDPALAETALALLVQQSLNRGRHLPRRLVWDAEGDGLPYYKGAFLPLDHLLLLARSALAQKRSAEASSWFQRAIRLRDASPDTPSQLLSRFTSFAHVLQQAARAAALAGEATFAIGCLRRLVGTGISNRVAFAEVLARDEDFRCCQTHPEWQAFMELLLKKE